MLVFTHLYWCVLALYTQYHIRAFVSICQTYQNKENKTMPDLRTLYNTLTHWLPKLHNKDYYKDYVSYWLEQFTVIIYNIHYLGMNLRDMKSLWE